MTMEKKRRGRWRWVVPGFVLVVAGYPVAAVLSAGHGWRTSDWNRDGRTTPGEWFLGMDVGTRSVVVQGQACTEYFDFKDGMPLRVDCPVHG
jgi:hypothetical protein